MSSSPPSPGVSAVSLAECVEPLLHLVLSSFAHGEALAELDLRLSPDYCSQLLAQDPNPPEPDHLDLLHTDDGSEVDGGGVPLYPLYKQVAWGIRRCLAGDSVRRSAVVQSIREDESLKEKEEEWKKLIVDKGFELQNMLEKVDFEIHVQEPFFTQLRNGSKRVEGKCAVGDYNRMAPGALLLVNRCLLLEIQIVRKYSSFAEMIKVEGLTNVLPGVKTIEEGVLIYRKFYTEDKEKTNGVLAVCVSAVTYQPYVVMASLISGLGYGGIGILLGLTQTAGTVDDALPPPRSTLVSSFMMPYKPEVKGSTLIHGARALAKHVNRSSGRWWGNLQGNDYYKNDLSLKTIIQLITQCRWMNIHFVQPNLCVLEIRVADGYGARWSLDGSKFIGFVEPYMKEGHSTMATLNSNFQFCFPFELHFKMIM